MVTQKEKPKQKKPKRERELHFLTFLLSHKRYFCKAAELSQGAEALLCAWQGLPHGTTYFGEKFCLTLWRCFWRQDTRNGLHNIILSYEGYALLSQTSAGLCKPQNKARKNMPLTGAAQRGFTCQQFPCHCRISVKCHRHGRFFVLRSIILRQKPEGNTCSQHAGSIFIRLLFSTGTACATDWKLLGIYGKMKRSRARDLHIKYVYVCTLSWSFLLQEKKLKYFNIILPWEGKITNIWGKILK